MDETEQRAEAYLVAKGFPAPVFEPDGRVPPDFLVDGRIAVEVRRLTQLTRSNARPEALEELTIPLITRIQALAATFGPPDTEAWLLTLDFKRPLPRWRHLHGPIYAFLQEVQRLGPGGALEAEIHPNLRLEASPGSPVRTDMFHLGVTHDKDSGGWMWEELELSLKHAIEEKTSKVAPYQERYPEWWLLLLDHVTYARPLPPDFALFCPRPWQRLTLVNPLSPAMSLDVPLRGLTTA
jgi:hypothetical protein